MFKATWARFFGGARAPAQPDLATPALQTGLAHHQAGRLREAEQIYTQALKRDPRNADLLHLLGVVAAQTGRNEQAVELIDRALSIKADFAEAWCNRGNAMQDLKRHGEAVASYDTALAINPRIAEALSNRGNALKALKRYDEALASYDKALSVRHDYAEAWFNRGTALQELKQLDAAVASYDRAIAIHSGYAEAYYNRGTALQALNLLYAAAASYDRAVAIKSDYAEAYSNRGTVLLELMQLQAAAASYDCAIVLKPDYADFYYNKSFVLLLGGDFAGGLPLYEWRWKRKAANRRELSRPLWLGRESLAGKTILLHSEQGFGDTIQFCRYARQVANLGARVLLELPPPLMPLLKNLAGVDEFLPHGSPLPEFDYHCPLLSLPLAFNTDLDSIPSSPRYLVVDDERLAKWRERLGEKTKPRIGLAWSGRPEHKFDHTRSMALAEFVSHLPANFQYVSLQKDVRDPDRPMLDAWTEILHFGDELQDFADTAALCEQLDLVISVDTSVAHLAGALGRPLWLLLPFRPDWRWLLERSDSPWYPSARLFRKEKHGDWNGVLERVCAELNRHF